MLVSPNEQTEKYKTKQKNKDKLKLFTALKINYNVS